MDLPAHAAPASLASGVGIQDVAAQKIDDPHLGMRIGFANRPDHEIAPGAHSQHRRCFSHSISFEDRDSYEVEKLVHMRLQRAASRDGPSELPADNGAEFFQNDAIEEPCRDDGCQPEQCVFESQLEALQRPPLVFIELLALEKALPAFHIAGYRVSQMEELLSNRRSGFHVRQDFKIEILPKSRGGGHHGGADRFQILRQSAQRGVVGANATGDREHFKSAFVAVPDRQDRQRAVAWTQSEREVFNLRAHIGVGELHPLRSASGSRGVDDCAKILRQNGARAFLRGAVARLAFARPLGGQLLQSINSLRRRNVFGRHYDDSTQVGQLRAAMLDEGQHSFVLHKDKTGVGMRENINQLRIGDVGAPGHIGGSSQKNGVVRKNPLQAVVGEQSHMLAGLHSQSNQGCRQI